MVPAEHSLPELPFAQMYQIKDALSLSWGTVGLCSGSTGMNGTAHHPSHQGEYCSALQLIWPGWGNQITEHSEDIPQLLMLVP